LTYDDVFDINRTMYYLILCFSLYLFVPYVYACEYSLCAHCGYVVSVALMNAK